MKLKPAIFCCLLIVFVLPSCIKTNSTIPITAFQMALQGKWQADSMVITINGKRFSDTTYVNHYINITNDGPILSFDMTGSDKINYTLSDSSLVPFSTRRSAGCGSPITSSKLQLLDNHLKMIIGEPYSNSITYMHKIN
jgi:hypothetical protein